ncbi:MFS transporter [Streptomyces cinereoruber]|uniref:MFS transporter n=1 Tax=Streptomyces cinereoruber TaxID=67260 RepID=UPI00362E4D7C
MPQPDLTLTPAGPALAPRYDDFARTTDTARPYVPATRTSSPRPHGPARTTDGPARTADAPVRTTDDPARTADAPARTTDDPARTTDGPARKAGDPARATGAPGRPVDSPGRPAGEPDTAPARPYGRGRRPAPSRNPYRLLFARPGARAFAAWGLIARLPAGMFGVSAVIMIAAVYDSYALAGAVTATGLAVGSVTAPLIARLVDRHGQARIAVPAAAYATLGHLVLALCVHERAPVWALFATVALTATSPNTGGMSRARWAHLLRDDPGALHTANSFEQAVDELCFMLGPVLAAVLCSALFPQAGTLAAAALFLGGTLLFAAQRSTEPPVAPRTPAGSPLRAPGMVPLLAVFLATGAVFGSMEVVTLAYVDGPVAGPVLALQAAGSCAAGLLYGRVRRTARLRTCLAAMTALMALPLLAASAGSLLALAAGLLVAGMATAPTMVTGMGLVQRLTPADRLNEGMTLAVTALLAGIATGSASGGWAADHAPFPSFGFLIPLAAAATALTLCAAFRTDSHHRRETGTTIRYK